MGAWSARKPGNGKSSLPPPCVWPPAGSSLLSPDRRCAPGSSISSLADVRFAVKVPRTVDELECADMPEQQPQWKVRHEIGIVAEPEHRYANPGRNPASPTRGDPNVYTPCNCKDGSSLQRFADSVASAAPRLWPVIHSGLGCLACSALTCATVCGHTSPSAARNPVCTRSPCESGNGRKWASTVKSRTDAQKSSSWSAEREHDRVRHRCDVGLRAVQAMEVRRRLRGSRQS